MDDAEYLFHSEIREKKSISHGAYHKKNGSKSHKCSLPSDRLTRKERAAMNSDITTWSMTAFYSYSTFKSMPSDLQVEYLQGITDKWRVGCGAINDILFKNQKGTLSSYLDHRGISDKIKWNGFTGMKARTYNAEFTSAVNEAFGVPEVPTAIASSDEPYSGTLAEASISMMGFDMDTFSWLAQKDYGQDVKVTIIVESK